MQSATASTPSVSVIMAVHNGERFIASAIDSVLAQSLPNFELIVVDDCSDDATPRLLKEFSDRRISVLCTDVRSGAGAARNVGVEAARGRYIAILDADDIAMPHRLAVQVRQLDARPELAIVSSPVVFINHEGRRLGFHDELTGSLAVRWRSIFTPAFTHSAAMIRRSAFGDDPAYDGRFPHSEDYDLYIRLLARSDGDNWRSPLICVRQHDGRLTRTRRALQLDDHDRIASRAFEQEVPGLDLDPQLFGLLWRRVAGLPGAGDSVELGHAYLDIFDAFARRHARNPELPTARREAAVVVAKRFLARPSTTAGSGLAKRLFTLDHLAPIAVPLTMGRGTLKHLRWRIGPRK